MNHGRSIASACIFAALFATRVLADTPTTAPAPSPFKITCGLPDHPSGLYYVKGEAKVTLTVDNISRQPQEFSGEITFGPATHGTDIKAISVTPIQASTIGPNQRVTIPLTLTFGAAGDYQLNWRRDNLETAIGFADENAGVGLRCIFAPRPAKPEESPWLAVLPSAAVSVPGFLTDYMQQTTVRRFLINERFSYDAKTNIGLGFGAATGAGSAQIDALLAEATKAKAQLLLRLAVPLADGGNAKVIDAFKTYLIDAVRRSHGTLSAIAIAPDRPPEAAWSPAQRAAFRAFYLAGYESTKRADKSVQFLGAGSAGDTLDLLLHDDPRLLGYIDALALDDAAGEPATAAPLVAARKMPVYILPSPGGKSAPPAAALAQHAAIVPVPSPELDNGVTAHLLNGAVFVQRLVISVPTADPTAPDTSNIPFIAIFQGDGYSVAAVAGFSAGTDLDAQYPALARTPTSVEPQKPDEKPYANLQVGDDSRSMRVVDAAGAPVDCRIGDSIYVPAEDAVVYLLEAGSALDLASTLMPASTNRLPLLEITPALQANALSLHLRNISAHPQSGTIRLLRPPTLDHPATVLAEKELPQLPAGKQADMPLLADMPSGTLVVELTTTGPQAVIQRTAISLP